MKIISFSINNKLKYGILEGEYIEEVNSISELKPTGTTYSIKDVKIEPPIIPTSIFCTLVNTPTMLGVKSKAEAMELLDTPKFFIKLPTTVVGYGDYVISPKSGIRPEVEIGALIIKKLKHASKSEVINSILGYTVFNDVTAPLEGKKDWYYAYRRDPYDNKVKKVLSRGSHFRNKNRDTFSPIGPWIVTTEELSSIEGLTMRSIYDGEIIQEGSSDEFVFGIEEIIVELSKILTIPPYSIITSGTIGYKGVEDPSEFVLEPKETEIAVEVEKIGMLVNFIKIEI
jgi:2-keto-4-pentenoate hydratase/2-oxohepta-3-ene-1,7-dioic acid hydratase in catechol pathway